MLVQHLPEQQQFVVDNPPEQAVLQYRMGSGPTGPWIDFHHTYVPPSLRGAGIAALLTAAGLAWASAQGWRVIASCSYVARYIASQS